MVALRSDQERAALPRRVPVDLLPEHSQYRDTGCELSPSCLRCPLPRCKYDAPYVRGGPDRLRRDREIALLHARYDAPVELLAAAYGISRRHVFRILSAAGTKKCQDNIPSGRDAGAPARAHRRKPAPDPAQLPLPEISAHA